MNVIILQYKRASGPEIRGPYNANKRSRYVELVLVVDNREYKDMGESLYKVYQHCKEIANIINGVSTSLIKLKYYFVTQHVSWVLRHLQALNKIT